MTLGEPESVDSTQPRAPGFAVASKTALRQRAERELRTAALLEPEHDENISPEHLRRILYELRVHQIELEMQNEELRRAQTELETSQARYFDLYDLAPVGYCVVDPAGNIVQANLRVATILGVSRRELIHQPISRYIQRWDQDVYYLCHRRLEASAQEQTCELRMVKADGTRCWLQVTINAEPDASGTVQTRMILNDIADRKRLELKLRSAAAVSQKANRAKSKFLANANHELRTPLTAIIGYAQLMECSTPAPNADMQHCIDQISGAGQHLLELIEGLLELAQIETGKLPLSLEPVSLPEILHECRAMIEPQALARQVELAMPKPGSGYQVIADRTKVKQVILNLLSNGIKYNRLGGSLSIYLACHRHGRVRVCIQDTGHGLTPAQLGNLFQPFNRLGQANSTTPGTGLGLSLSKRLIELMGGTIGVQSTVGQGSLFWIELALIEGDSGAADTA